MYSGWSLVVSEWSVGGQWWSVVVSGWSLVAQIFEFSEWSVGSMSIPWVISG